VKKSEFAAGAKKDILDKKLKEHWNDMLVENMSKDESALGSFLEPMAYRLSQQVMLYRAVTKTRYIGLFDYETPMLFSFSSHEPGKRMCRGTIFSEGNRKVRSKISAEDMEPIQTFNFTLLEWLLRAFDAMNVVDVDGWEGTN